MTSGRVRRLGALAAALALLAGCAPLDVNDPSRPADLSGAAVAGESSTDPNSAAGPNGAADPNSAADPHALRGPATAVVDHTSIDPISPSPTPRLPATVSSFDGTTVTVTDASRILALDLYGSLAEVVFTLGLGDSVVGRDRATGFPEADHLPVVTGSGHDLNAEAILALAPTVILTDTSIGPAAVQEQLRTAGIAVIYFDPARTLSGIGVQIESVAAALGVPAAGRELADRVDREIDGIETAPSGTEPLRVAFLYLRGTAGVYLLGGPGSGADALLTRIGARDVGTQIGLTKSFSPLTSEALIKANPDVLLVMTEGLRSVGGVDELAAMAGVAQTIAGEHRRIVDMADTVLLSFGPRTPAVLRALADALYRPDGSAP